MADAVLERQKVRTTMIPYPSDRMIINAEYDRGYANGQRDILETLKKDITHLHEFNREEILKLIDSYRGR